MLAKTAASYHRTSYPSRTHRRARSFTRNGRLSFRTKVANADAAHTLYCDGGTIGGSPGKAIYWSVGTEDRRHLLREKDESGRHKRSDEAELSALRSALRMMRTIARRGEFTLIRMDCRPLINKVNEMARGGAVMRADCSPKTAALLHEVLEILFDLRESGVSVRLEWTPRETIERVLGH